MSTTITGIDFSLKNKVADISLAAWVCQWEEISSTSSAVSVLFQNNFLEHHVFHTLAPKKEKTH